jgi:hypothetical protein
VYLEINMKIQNGSKRKEKKKNPGGDEVFRLSIPALMPTKPLVKRVPGLSWG